MRKIVGFSCTKLLFALIALVPLGTVQAAHYGDKYPTGGKSLGVAVSELPFETLSSMELDYGVRIERTFPGSPAEAAGLKTGDVIVEFLGKPVYSVKRLQWLVSQAPSNEPVAIRLQRQGSTQDLTVEFRRPEPADKPSGMAPKSYGQPSAFMGAQIQAMTPQLRNAFGAPEDAGVLVSGILEGGPAATAGVTPGDVIVRIDRKTIRHTMDFYRALRYFDPGDPIEIEVIRDKASNTLTVELGETVQQMPKMPWHHGWRPMPPHPGMPFPGYWPMGRTAPGM